MKKIAKVFLPCLLAAAMLLSSCSRIDNAGGDTTEPSVTDGGGIHEDAAKHELSVSEVKGILAENGMETNINSLWLDDGASYHGGQQMRVCHTERGTYAAFAKDFGGYATSGIQKFYVAKVDNEGKSSILHYGEFTSDGNEILVNIGQDLEGNIIVTVTSMKELEAFIFDSENDQMEKIAVVPQFETEKIGGKVNGYSQSMFDFENRKIYGFYNGRTDDSFGDYVLEWFVFDMDTKTWSENGTLKIFEGMERHCYLYPFPDGNGGTYVTAMIAEYAKVREGQLLQAYDRQFVFDRIDLFHIPDLTTPDNITYVTVHDIGNTDRGMEGIWPSVNNNLNGDVFVDSNGYMHITYQYYLHDYAGSNTEYDDQLQYRHAVYDGMDCLYNEEIKLPRDDYYNYRPMVRQSTDGTLHMIVIKFSEGAIEFEFYRAEDDLGKSWKHEKHTQLDESITTHSPSVSAVRDGSVQDNTLSCFFYGYRNLNRTAYTFNISLEDYSITEPIDILEDFDIQVDWRYDKRLPATDEQTQVINTENGTYVTFVYNFKYLEGTEYFHIVKIGKDNKVTVLASDSFKSMQDKYLTMTEGIDGKIYVCLPSGRHTYVIDTVTDEVTYTEMTPFLTEDLFTRQVDIVTDPAAGNEYYISILDSDGFKVDRKSVV